MTTPKTAPSRIKAARTSKPTTGATAIPAENRLIEVMEVVPHGFALYDADDRLVFANSRVREIFSLTADVMTPGRSFSDLVKACVDRGIYPGNRKQREAYARFRLALHRDPQGPHEQFFADGQFFRLIERRMPDGSTVCMWTDLTHLRRQEDALSIIVGHRSAGISFLEAASQALAVGLGCRWAGLGELLPDGRHVRLLGYWQDGAAGDLFTYDLAGTPCAGLYEQQRSCFYPDRVAQLFPDDRILAEMGVVSYRGETFCDDTGRMIGHVFALDDKPATPNDRSERFIRLIANWVSTELQRRQAERALREAKEAAEQASRAKGEFLANMSHELRTPLNAIIGFSEIMHSEVLGPTIDRDQYRGYATDIHQSGNHLLALINSILEMSEAAGGRVKLVEEAVDCIALIATCLHSVEDRARQAGVTLSHTLPRTLPRLRADELRLRQILTGLLSNAVKFTARGGCVTVSAMASQRRGFTFTVADTGIGIAKQDMAQIMQPFGQIAGSPYRRSEGAGLGLPFAKALVELHGGSLRIDSAVGVGTTATVQLPPDRIIPAMIAK